MHKVKCVKCGKEFDRDVVPAVAVGGRRYAHENCEEANKVKEIKDTLEKYIKAIFKISILSAKIKRQLEDYKREYQYSDLDILKTLVYWFEIKKSPIEKANGGIGIVPYVYNEARTYFDTVAAARAANNKKVDNDFIIKERIIEITSPRVAEKPIRLFNLDGGTDIGSI